MYVWKLNVCKWKKKFEGWWKRMCFLLKMLSIKDV